MEDIKYLTYNLLLHKHKPIKKLDYDIFFRSRKTYESAKLNYSYIRNIGIIIFTNTELFIAWDSIGYYLELLKKEKVCLKYLDTNHYINSGHKKRKLFILK